MTTEPTTLDVDVAVTVKVTARRGTSNTNDRGSSHSRRARRAWLIETYRANVDVPLAGSLVGTLGLPVPLGEGTPACRCYRCGRLLTDETVTVDRIIPGCKGGTYRRNNIRPACAGCNSETGGRLAHENRRTRKAKR